MRHRSSHPGTSSPKDVTVCPRTGKIRHRSMRLAKRALRSLGHAGVEKRLHPYKCPACDGYHLGNPKPGGKR